MSSSYKTKKEQEKKYTAQIYLQHEIDTRISKAQNICWLCRYLHLPPGTSYLATSFHIKRTEITLLRREIAYETLSDTVIICQIKKYCVVLLYSFTPSECPLGYSLQKSSFQFVSLKTFKFLKFFLMNRKLTQNRYLPTHLTT